MFRKLIMFSGAGCALCRHVSCTEKGAGNAEVQIWFIYFHPDGYSELYTDFAIWRMK